MNNDKCEFCNGTGKEPGEAGCVWCFSTGRKEGQKMLTQPAEQHQGEPVAWINFPDEYNKTPFVTWRSPDEQRFYNSSIGAVAFSTTRMCLTPLYTRPAQGEPVALPDRREYPDPHDKGRYGPFDPKYEEDCAEAEGWNACLDEIAKLGPLYTHADPGEVERLRELLRKLAQGSRDQLSIIEALRAQLAEQDALLREASAAIKQGDVDFDAVYSSCRNWDELVKDGVANEVALKIDAALSAGAEPSAPIWEGRISNCEVWVNKCSNCGETHRLLECAQAERIEVALSASAEPSDSADLGSCQRRPAWATDGRINTADLPVERDERAEFESKFSTFQLQRHPQHPDCYENPGVHYVWQGWQARAALERKP